MAEIEMERRPRRNTWIWVAAALLVLVLAVGAWLLFVRGTTGYEPGPATDRPVPTRPAVEPAEPVTELPQGDLPQPEPADSPGTPDPDPRP